jgi:hypothetical protein
MRRGERTKSGRPSRSSKQMPPTDCQPVPITAHEVAAASKGELRKPQ